MESAILMLLFCICLNVFCADQLGGLVGKLVSIQPCKDTENKDPHADDVDIKLWTKKVNRRKSTLLYNITVKRKIGPVSVNMRTHEWSNGKWAKTNELIGIPCNSPLMKAIIWMPMSDDCYILPNKIPMNGEYEVGSAHPIMSFLWTNGRYSWQVETVTKNGTLFCIEGIADMTLKKS